VGEALQGRLDQLIALANSTDGGGNYLFSGFQGKTIPFVNTEAGVQYMGDDGQRMVQVSASRQMPSSDSGADIFVRIKNGNGTFVTQAAATNTGSGVVSLGGLANPPPTAAQVGNSYTLTFTSATTYTVTGTDASGAALPAASLPAPNSAFVSGQNISFNGVQFDIQGVPSNGDSFTVTPSVNESVFKTISDLVIALKVPVSSTAPGSAALLTGSLSRGLNNLDNALNKVLTTRSSLGLRLNEIDALQTAGDDLALQFKQALSQLQDVDYNKALSDLSQQQISLQAAQQSFVKVSNLSLFNYL
jgi:flagellar hook-associated protein 3 FlgL